jgi:hypothetical protein
MSPQEHGQQYASGNHPEVLGRLEVVGKVSEVTRSYIPNVMIYTVDCGGVKVRFDAHSRLLRLKPGDAVAISISKELPSYNKGVDFVMWGYVISVKNDDEQSSKIVLSLWGFIVIVEASKREFLSGFNVMDKVYFKVARLST